MKATRDTVVRAALLLAAVGLAVPAMGQRAPVAAASQQAQATAQELAAIEAQAQQHPADLQRMLRDLQAVQTSDQAKKYQADLMRDGAPIGDHARAFKAWRERAAQVTAGGAATGLRMDARAEALNQQVAQTGSEVEAQMRRVAALYPPIGPLFKQFRSLLH